MKKYSILILLSIIAILSCSDEPVNPDDQKSIKILGLVGFDLDRLSESGQYLGNLYDDEFISGIKIELISANKTVATTYTKESISDNYHSGGYFLFDNIQAEAEYKLKVILDKDYFLTSDPFIISEDDLHEIDYIGFFNYFYRPVPDWFEKGIYYLPSDHYTTIHIPVLENEAELIVFPQPIIDNGFVEFIMAESGNCKIEIITHKFETVKVVLSNFMQIGKHITELNMSGLDNGMYFVKLSIGENIYYYPFKYKTPIE